MGGKKGQILCPNRLTMGANQERRKIPPWEQKEINEPNLQLCFFGCLVGQDMKLQGMKATWLQGHMGMCEYLWAQGGPKMADLGAQNT